MACVFCEIAAGRIPCHKVWENDTHLAFLSIFPNSEGMTVVIPKVHKPSYVFDLDEPEFVSLMSAAKTVAKRIDAAFPDVGRTAVVCEGFGVDHAHAKLFPMHGTPKTGEWTPVHSSERKVFKRYEGYISSHDGPREDDTVLAATAEKIRSVKA